MSTSAGFTGERYLPGIVGEIAYEHWHRYAFARRFVAGKRVLDAACGEGYGTAVLARHASSAVGVDIDGDVVASAREAYGSLANLSYETGSVTQLPIRDASIDVVVSFETIEHLTASDQPAMLAEFARVLAPGGLLIVSSPNKRRYSDARNYTNPFHLHELYREELAALLSPVFPALRWYRQAPAYVSALWSEAHGDVVEAWAKDGQGMATMPLPEALYFIVLAAKEAASLPPGAPWLSLFGDREESELARIDAQAREVLRQDTLVRERDAALDRQMAHIGHLERLVAERERLVEERDRIIEQRHHMIAEHERICAAREAELGDAQRRIRVLEEQSNTLAADNGRLDAALEAQERIIAYRQSLRWWMRMPWLRLRLAWQRSRD